MRKQIAIAAALAVVITAANTTAHDGDDHKARSDDGTAFTSAIPQLSVKSVEASIEHYTAVLGFVKNWDWPDDSEDKDFASVSNGDVTLFFAESDGDAQPYAVYYTVADVDRLYARYKAAKADITGEPADKPWGMREFLVADPDGHVLRIGQPLEHDHEDHEDQGDHEDHEDHEDHGEGHDHD